MLKFLKFVRRKHPYLGALLVVALVGMLFFAISFSFRLYHFSNPENQNRPIEPWMSLGYVAKSWALPKQEMLQILAIPEGGVPIKRPRTVAEYLRQSGQTLDEFEAQLRAAQIAIEAEAAHD